MVVGDDRAGGGGLAEGESDGGLGLGEVTRL